MILWYIVDTMIVAYGNCRRKKGALTPQKQWGDGV